MIATLAILLIATGPADAATKHHSILCVEIEKQLAFEDLTHEHRAKFDQFIAADSLNEWIPIVDYRLHHVIQFLKAHQFSQRDNVILFQRFETWARRRSSGEFFANSIVLDQNYLFVGKNGDTLAITPAGGLYLGNIQTLYRRWNKDKPFELPDDLSIHLDIQFKNLRMTSVRKVPQKP